MLLHRNLLQKFIVGLLVYNLYEIYQKYQVLKVLRAVKKKISRPCQISINSNPKILKMMEKINQIRLKNLQEKCVKYPDSPSIMEEYRLAMQNNLSDVSWHIDPHSIVDFENKLLYCDLPKCGSTNWKTTIGILSGNLRTFFIEQNWGEMGAK